MRLRRVGATSHGRPAAEGLTFQNKRKALADPDAERGNTDATPAPGKLMRNRPGEPGPGRTERMPEGDRTTLRIEDRGIELGPLGHTPQHLRRERLVQLQHRQVVEPLPALASARLTASTGASPK